MRKNLSGQVGLLLLVVLGLVISVVLSIAARSLSDVVLSRQERENNAAFSIAESGIEAALLAISEGGTLPEGSLAIGDSIGLVSGQYRIGQINSFDLFIKAGEAAEIDLSGYVGPSVTLRWTKSADSSENVGCTGEGANNAPAALEVIAVKSDQSVERDYYNAYNCALGNGFADSLIGSDGFRSSVVYTLPSGTSLLRLKPLYTGATLQVTGNSSLTTQMYLVESEAAGGDADKEIQVTRSRDAAGSIFDYALFSGESIIK